METCSRSSDIFIPSGEFDSPPPWSEKGYAKTGKFLRHTTLAGRAAIFICPKRVWKIKSFLAVSVCVCVREKAKVEQLLPSSFYVANLLARAGGHYILTHFPSPLHFPHASLFVALFVYHKQ